MEFGSYEKTLELIGTMMDESYLKFITLAINKPQLTYEHLERGFKLLNDIQAKNLTDPQNTTRAFSQNIPANTSAIQVCISNFYD